MRKGVAPDDKISRPQVAVRHGAIDLLRIAAVTCVVFYHAGVVYELPTLIGMHALIVASIAFAARPLRGTPADVISMRASRLLVPWLFFAVVHFASAVRNHSVVPFMFFIGGSMHLWFVPFIFVATCGVALYSRAKGLPKDWSRVLVWSAAALVLIHLEARFTPVLVPLAPIWQLTDGATAALVAMAVLSVPGDRLLGLAVATLLASTGVALWVPWRQPNMMSVPPAGFGAVLFLAIRQLPAGANAITNFLGRASFGLYLMHMLVISAIVKIAFRVKFLAPGEVVKDRLAVCAGLTVITCLIIIAVAERTPARRLIV